MSTNNILSTIKIPNNRPKMNRDIKAFQPNDNRILLTGATGFVGSLLLRDLLLHRDALGIGGGVVVVVRKKRNIAVQDRVDRLLSDSMFSFLTKEQKKDLVHPIEGDIAQENAGLKESDIQWLCHDASISHLIHCAADVSFNQELSDAAKSNILPTLALQDLAKKVGEHVLFVYISTAFVHGGNSGEESCPLPEDLHPLGSYDANDIYRSMLNDEDSSYADNAMRELGFPNTYAFSKCVCEHLLRWDALIIRPSIITPSVESPFQGWAGSKPSTIVAGAVLSMACPMTVWSFGPHKVPFVPVDVVTRFILAAAFRDTMNGGYPSKRIFNATWNAGSSQDALFSWKEYVVGVFESGRALGQFNRASATLGKFWNKTMVLRMGLKFKSFKRVHGIFLKTPLKAGVAIQKMARIDKSGLSRLLSFIDLPLLFFPFMNNEFHFDSDLDVPQTFDKKSYMFACIAAADSFIRSSKK